MTSDEPVVFVVDDNRSVRKAITGLLASVGIRVETFRTAQDFLRTERADVPACVVLDVRLPGLSGLELQQRQGPAVELLRREGDAGVDQMLTLEGALPEGVEATSSKSLPRCGQRMADGKHRF
jgi:DNA-binding NtrC family response regulator